MRNLLVVEDERSLGRLLRTVLEHEGYRVVLARSAQEALDAAWADKPDLILMDVQLPGVSGFLAVEAIREVSRLSSVPIVLVSGALDPESLRGAAREIGADDALPKPFDLPQFVAVVRRWAGATSSAARIS